MERLCLGIISETDDAGRICLPHAKNGYFAYYTAMDMLTENTFMVQKDEYI